MTSNPPDFQPLSRTQVLIAMGLTALVWLIVAKIWLQTPFSGGLLPLRWHPLNLVLGVGVGGGIVLTSAGIYQLWPGYRRAADFYLQLVLQPLVWGDLIWLGLLPGLSEELLFRGVVLPAAGLDVTGLVISSVCFGVLHLSGLQQWPYVVWATIVGLGLGLSALLSGSLLVPIVAHISANLLSSLLWKWQHQAKPNSIS